MHQTICIDTYLNDGTTRQPEKVAIQLLESTRIHSVYGHMRSDIFWTKCSHTSLLLVSEVTAGNTGLEARAVPDVITHCHLVRHTARPHPSPQPQKRTEKKIN